MTLLSVHHQIQQFRRRHLVPRLSISPFVRQPLVLVMHVPAVLHRPWVKGYSRAISMVSNSNHFHVPLEDLDSCWPSPLHRLYGMLSICLLSRLGGAKTFVSVSLSFCLIRQNCLDCMGGRGLPSRYLVASL